MWCSSHHVSAVKLIFLITFTLQLIQAQSLSQSLSAIPACAQSCFVSAIQSSGCGTNPASCVCGNSAFIQSARSCICSACSTSDSSTIYSTFRQYCATIGVSINLEACDSSGSTSTTNIDNMISSMSVSASASAASASSAIASYLSSLTKTSVSSGRTSQASTRSSRSSSATKTSSESSASTVAPTVTSSSDSSNTLPVQEGGLSTGAKAGIGVGVALGVLFAIGIIAFFVRRHLRISWISHKQDTESKNNIAKLSATDGKAELGEKDYVDHGAAQKMVVNARETEMNGHGNRYEAQTNANRHELAGDFRSSGTLNGPWSSDSRAELP